MIPGFYGSECKGARFFGGSSDGFDSKVRLESDSENLDRKKLCQVFLKKKDGQDGKQFWYELLKLGWNFVFVFVCTIYVYCMFMMFILCLHVIWHGNMIDYYFNEALPLQNCAIEQQVLYMQMWECGCFERRPTIMNRFWDFRWASSRKP